MPHFHSQLPKAPQNPAAALFARTGLRPDLAAFFAIKSPDAAPPCRNAERGILAELVQRRISD